jgi:uncharacterized protein
LFACQTYDAWVSWEKISFLKTMINRDLLSAVKYALEHFPAVTMIGARQVGKTTLALQLSADIGGSVFDMENPQHRLMLEDPMTVLSELRGELVVIDEAQRMEELFPVLRVLIDQDRRPGRFLLLGSASPDLHRQSAESLAGRNKTLVLHPLTIAEVGSANKDKLWIRGGFPLSFTAGDNVYSMEWRQAYLKDLVERDLRLLGFDLPPERMRRFILMLAHLHGQLWNASQLARSLGIGTTTAGRYLDVMQQTLLVKRLSPYYVNLGKRLTKSPKVYLADSGLLHALLNVESKLDLLAHPVAGTSWEGFVLQQLDAVLPVNWEISFWRTAAGAEIDLLILRNNKPFIAIECKVNATNPRPSRGYYQACDDLNIENRWVIYPGEKRLPLPHDSEVIPLSDALVRMNNF